MSYRYQFEVVWEDGNDDWSIGRSVGLGAGVPATAAELAVVLRKLADALEAEASRRSSEFTMPVRYQLHPDAESEGT